MVSDIDRRAVEQHGRPMTGAESAVVASCLRAYLLRIYAYMMLGLSITGFAALGLYRLAVLAVPAGAADGVDDGLTLTAFGHAVVDGPLRWPVVLAPLAMAVLVRLRSARMSQNASEAVFCLYAALVGLSLAVIFLVFAATPVVQVFFVASASFGALSLWGRLSGREFSRATSFLVIGLAGTGIACLTNALLGNAALEFAVSIAGVLAFAGLTAWETQGLEADYVSGAIGGDPAERSAIVAALTLYLKFISFFIVLAHVVGGRQD
jgi:FtsH-binding integral membrane protein